MNCADYSGRQGHSDAIKIANIAKIAKIATHTLVGNLAPTEIDKGSDSVLLYTIPLARGFTVPAAPITLAEPLSKIRSETIKWLWEPYLPRGKVVLLDGDPGIGKSLLCIDLASRLSRGGPLPNGATANRPQVTLLLNAEDDPNDTTRPRAEAAGADLDRIIVASLLNRFPLSFPKHLPGLADLVRKHRLDLIVIDPITAFLGRGVAANSEAGVRPMLALFNLLAERQDCTILLVRHLRKASGGKAIHRGLGSIGFVASVRTGLLAAKHPTEPGRAVFAATKSNLAGAIPTLGYRIATDAAGRAIVEWGEPVDVAADALDQLPPRPLRSRDRAATWLHAELAGGPRRAMELFAAAAAAGIPERTLNRAKRELQVRSHRLEGQDRAEWYWYDPSASWPAIAPFAKPQEVTRF